MTKIIQNIVHQIVDEHMCERFVIKFKGRGAPVWAHVRGQEVLDLSFSRFNKILRCRLETL